MLLPLILLIAQSQPAAATCDADGVVVNSITGQPIPRAHVMANPTSQVGAVADAVGHWQISGLPCGRFTLSASKTGFLTGPAKPATLPAHDLRIELVPQSVLVGRVLDDQGDPIANAQIAVFSSRILMGRRTPAQSTGGNTNDLGEFRIAGQPFGKIIVCARSPGDFMALEVLGESCYPGPVDSGMDNALSLPAGRELRIDFTLSKVPSSKISGRIVGAPENGAIGLSVTSRNAIRGGGGQNRLATVQRDGSFVARGIAPGPYTLSVDYWESGKRMMARVPVDVNGSDIDGIVVHLETGVSLSGTVRIESQSGAAPKPQQINVSLQSTDPMLGGGAPQWNKDRDAFSMNEVIPGSYTLNATVPAPFYLKSAMIGGRDMSKDALQITQPAGPVEVTIADDSGAIQGQVEDSNGDPVNGWVMVMREGKPPVIINLTPDGHYKSAGLAPGDYKVYAWDDFQQVEYANPDWMKRNGTAGVSVTVTAGQTTDQKLVRAVVPRD